MRIYTRTGDRGDTALLGGARVAKDDARVEAYGTVDELNAVLGLARAACRDAGLGRQLARIQQELFELGADLADPRSGPGGGSRVGEGHVEALEREIDAFTAEVPPLNRFVLPGGTELAARLHLARTVARRAERRGGAPAPPRAGPPAAGRPPDRPSGWGFAPAPGAHHPAGSPP
ncbi:MAG: cob(I)yrinic acid a,c-diamide adenosyltransferase, partial [Bacillota bacterium]